MNDTSVPPVAGASPPHGDRPSRIPTWLSRGLVVIAAATTLVWIGAIVFGAVGDYRPAGYLEDRSFPEAAEPVCSAAVADVADFPPARSSRTPAERAGVIVESTARLQRMVDDLRPLVPAGADARWINEWIDDWGTHLADRLDFAERLKASGAAEEFFETTKANAQISKSLDNFAEINAMESCATPDDV